MRPYKPIGRRKEGSVCDVDATYACHPSLVAIPGDFYPATRLLSLALGDQNSLLDQKSMSQIQDVMAKKTDVPHEVLVCNKSARVVGALLTSNLPCRYMKARSMGSPFEATGAAVKTAHSSLKSANRDRVSQVPERVRATPGRSWLIAETS